MFESLRYNLKNNRKGVLRNLTAWFIFAAIILVFVFWGLAPQQPGVATGGVAAHVNNRTISMAELGQAVERMSRDPRFQQFQALGGDAGRQILQQQALSQLVEMELIRQEALDQRLLTTDAEVRDVITSIPDFQQDGRFRRELYMGYLEAVRKTPGDFENEVRTSQSLQRAVRMFGASLRPLALETEKQKELAEMKANLQFASLPLESLVSPEKLSKADVAAFLEKEGVEARLNSYYETNKDEFSTPEQVRARHILVQFTSEDAESEKKAHEKIMEVAEKAKTGDFAKLATEYSEDPGSKSKGGDLGFFGRGRMVPEFEEAAFSLPVNEVSEPVKTDYGYHLIQVLEKKPAQTFAFEEVREKIAAELLAEERSKEVLAQLQEALKSNDQEKINQFIAAHNLKWEETGVFSIEAAEVPKIGSSDEAIRYAFTLTPEKPVADTLVRQGGQGFILRYKAVPPSATAQAEKEPNQELMNEYAASRRSDDVLRSWVEGLRKEADITLNTSVQGSVR